MGKEQGQKIVESKWIGRSLSNYLTTHTKTAESRGVTKAFFNARTLTEARKILFGLKRNQNPVKK